MHYYTLPVRALHDQVEKGVDAYMEWGADKTITINLKELPH